MHPAPAEEGMAPPASVEQRPSKWWFVSAIVLAVAMAVLYISPLAVPLTEDLDRSWQTILGRDLVEAKQFGRDSVFQYGVLGYFVVLDAPYISELYWPRLV